MVIQTYGEFWQGSSYQTGIEENGQKAPTPNFEEKHGRLADARPPVDSDCPQGHHGSGIRAGVLLTVPLNQYHV